ncbi:hypothetical protein NDU88_006950 [Pleurodeles waltl]|uniref:Uncharacterized protein n=1 Tax=Pleurodeles waltl TaxID=8319 RepID=A0AAV7PJW3_PLEWA|nr:hypothetical protein NDU88_006950 [Pleurodeles waltl]
MPVRNKMCTINAIIQPTMPNASPVWSGCQLEYRKPLQTLQNRALQIAAGARRADLHRDLGVEMLADHLHKLNERVYKGLNQKEKPLIKKIADIFAKPFDRYEQPITALTM